MGQYTPGPPTEPPTLVVVGHASRDLVDDDERGWRLGGSVSYVSLTAARLGIRVGALVGVDGEALLAPEVHLLRAAGVAVQPVVLPTAPIFRNVETPRGRRQECLAAGPTLDPDDVPSAWRGASAWAFVPVLGEVSGRQWAALAVAGAFVAVGWQGLLREARPGGATRPRRPLGDALLQRADLTVASDDDLAASGPSWSPLLAHRRIAHLFPRFGQYLVLTNAQRGGRLLIRTKRGWDTMPYAASPGRIVDPTGSGDVFLGAFVATLLDPSLVGPAQSGDPSAAPSQTEASWYGAGLQLAATTATMAAEGPGLSAIPTRSALRRRLAVGGA